MARDFTGGTDRVNFGSPSELDNLAAISVTAIIKADAINNLSSGLFPRFISKETGWAFSVSNTNNSLINNRLSFTVPYSTTALAVEGVTDQIDTTNTLVISATWDGSTNASGVKLYVNGVESASYGLQQNAAGTRTDDAASDLIIGNRSGGDRGFDGRISEAAIWNVVLTNAEITQLGQRMKPMRIRPQSIVFYTPLVRELIDLRGGLTGTATGTSVAEHPRVY